MRVKQLLVLLALVLFSVVAAQAAGTPQLTNVSVAGQGAMTVVTLHASGAFTHNEYRPTENLLLVDLAGISAGKLHERERALQLPGVKSYRVVGYTGAGGAQIARLELTLVGKPEVRINDTKDGLVIQLVPPADAASASPEAPSATPVAVPEPVAPAPVKEKPVATLKPAALREPVKADKPDFVIVRNVAVVQGHDGMEIEITATAPVKGTAMTLDNPDRLVIDLPNTVPSSRPRPIAVNSGGVRAVRMGQFQAAPPVTRVVVDLASAHDFDMVEAGNKLTLKLRPASAPTPATEPVAVVAEQPTKPAAIHKPAPQLKPVAAVETKHREKKVAEVKPAEAKPAPVQTAEAVSPKMEEAKPAEPKAAVAEPKAPTAEPKAEVKLAKANVEPEYKGGGQGAPEFVIAAPKIEEHRGNSPDPVPEPKLMAANNGPVSTPAMATPLPQNTEPQPQSPAAATRTITNATAQQTAPAPGAQAPVNFAAEQRQRQGQTAPAKPRYTGEPININVKDLDLRDFFRVIHEISGLNIVLDPNVSGSLTLVLTDVPWDQALDIVLKNNGLDRELEGNVLRVATVDDIRKEAEARRRQLEAQALAIEKVNATRFLSYAHAKDVLPTVRRMLSARGEIVADERTNALIIDDIPSVIPGIDTLLSQLDRKTQEVEIEARVVAATRTFIRDVGTQIGLGFGNSAIALGGAPGTQGNSSPIGAREPGSTAPHTPANAPYFLQNGQPASVPLFTNLAAINPTSGLALSNVGAAYRVDAILTMAESRGLLKILSRPRVITQNNIQAVVKQGQKVPIVTLGQLGGPPSVAYIEAVLRLTVTPQITVENTIFLNVDIENTTPDYSNKILGNPVFLTQQATTQVLVTNGGTVVIGGVLQSQNSLNVNQVPVLGSVPVLGNLFKRRGVNTATQELIFFITPRIVET